MSFLSKKELAKHKALIKDNDFDRFRAMELKNENEINDKDFASDDESPMNGHIYHQIFKQHEDDDDDNEGIDDLYEFWE